MYNYNHPIVAITFILMPFVYLATVYGALPAEIPIHFDWRGIPDAMGPKYLLWLLAGIGIPVILLINFGINRAMDEGESPLKHQAIGTITLAFTSLMLCYVIYGATQGGYNGLGGLSILFGLMWGALGNYLPVLKQNAYVGIRVPPTMNSEAKWRKTHRFAGPLFLLGGLALVVNGLISNGGTATVVMLIILGLTAVTTIVYAYRLPDDEGDLI